MAPNMTVPPSQCTVWAVPRVPICLLKNAHVFPPILLVLETKSGTVRRHNVAVRRIPRQQPEPTLGVFLEKAHILDAKLDRLFLLIPRSLHCILANAK